MAGIHKQGFRMVWTKLSTSLPKAPASRINEGCATAQHRNESAIEEEST